MEKLEDFRSGSSKLNSLIDVSVQVPQPHSIQGCNEFCSLTFGNLLSKRILAVQVPQSNSTLGLQ
jgi:hypothetical protein